MVDTQLIVAYAESTLPFDNAECMFMQVVLNERLLQACTRMKAEAAYTEKPIVSILPVANNKFGSGWEPSGGSRALKFTLASMFWLRAIQKWTARNQILKGETWIRISWYQGFLSTRAQTSALSIGNTASNTSRPKSDSTPLKNRSILPTSARHRK
mmetsp:Transcript_15538/g.42168  ORF Transcript_15538/g.42168 Transcript_15538/m.42168 type:complete len:156 (-) Transcript_15538:331-798(-)